MPCETPPPAAGPTAACPDAAQEPAAPIPGSLPLDLLVEPLRGQIEWVQRRHGLTPAAASLAALVTVLGVCGPSRRIDNPLDTRSLPPAFSVVLYGSPAAYIQAAVELSLDPVRQWMVRRIGPPDKQQLRRARLRIGELHQASIAKEFHINTAAVGSRIPGSEYGGALKGGELEAHQKTLKDEHAKILREINDTTFLLKPHLLADDAALPRLLDPGRLSTDGAVLHTSPAGHAVPAWTGAKNAAKAELARLLNLAWHGLPDAGDDDCHAQPLLSNLLVVDDAGARSLWSDRDLGVTGVLHHLFFMEAGQGGLKFDLSARCSEEIAQLWTDGLQALLSSRLSGRSVEHHLDRSAIEVFESFTRALLADSGTSAPGESRRLERTPVLALKLALLIHAISPGREEEAVGAKTIEFACALATAVASADLIFTNPAKPGVAPGGSTVKALVAKLRLRGPLPWRSLLRSFRNQKAEPLQHLLEKAIADGLVCQEGKLFRSVDPV